MLEIGVHNNNGITRSLLQTAEDRGFLTEVAGKTGIVDARVGGGKLPEDPAGIIHGAVVDEQKFQFMSCRGFILLPQGGDALMEFYDRVRFVIAGHDDTDFTHDDHCSTAEG